MDGDRVRVLVAKPWGGWTTTIPARIKEDHAQELGALRAAAKEATKTLLSEKVRLESMLGSDRTWPLNEWNRLYLDHPITGVWARQLIWAVADTRATVAVRIEDGALLDVEGAVVQPAPDALVRLWHPMAAPPDEVRQWRGALDRLERRQPFKQAWREVYLLTPAEEETGTYSNRFAGHILRYPQAFALMKGRD